MADEKQTTSKRNTKSKCSCCEQYFPTNTLIKKSGKKYCSKCIEVVNQESEDYKALIDYIYKTIFAPKEPPKLIFKQIQKFKEDNGWTYSGMLYSLQWYYDIKKNPIDRNNFFGIGIVEYIYEEARDFCKKIDGEYDRLDTIDITTVGRKSEITIDLSKTNPLINKNNRTKRLIDISSISVSEDQK